MRDAGHRPSVDVMDDREYLDGFAAFAPESELADEDAALRSRLNEDGDPLSLYETEDLRDRVLVRGDVAPSALHSAWPIEDIDSRSASRSIAQSHDGPRGDQLENGSAWSILRASRPVGNALLAGTVVMIGLLLSATLFRVLPSRFRGIAVSSPRSVDSVTTQTGPRPAAAPETLREPRRDDEQRTPPSAISSKVQLPDNRESAAAPSDTRNFQRPSRSTVVEESRPPLYPSPPSSPVSPAPLRTTTTTPPNEVSVIPISPGANGPLPAVAIALAPPLLESSASLATAVVPAPPPTPPVALAPAAPSVTPIDAIQRVLQDYKLAFSRLDADAAHGVWPTVDRKALSKAFDRLQEQNLELETCDISVAGAHAVASCVGTARYVPKVGTRSVRTERRHWQFTLHHLNESWVINSVDARQPKTR